MRGMISIQFHFTFEILGKNIWYSGKKYPNRNEIFIHDPTENILKNMSRFRTGFGLVQSGPWETWVFGLPHRSLILIGSYCHFERRSACEIIIDARMFIIRFLSFIILKNMIVLVWQNKFTQEGDLSW